jgi:hypothetical protein
MREHIERRFDTWKVEIPEFLDEVGLQTRPGAARAPPAGPCFAGCMRLAVIDRSRTADRNVFPSRTAIFPIGLI